MCEKLFTLCQLQLGSIVADLEHSADRVNSAAARIMQSFGEHREDERSREEDTSGEAGLAGTVKGEMRNIIMGLQFHDELNQRLQHLQTLLRLLEEQPRVPGQAVDQEQLLSRLSRIFSSNAEFKQLKKVFPGCQVAGSTDAIELF